MAMMHELRKTLLEHGATLVGYANIDVLSPETRGNMPFGISIAVALNPKIIAEIQNGPTKQYFDEYNRVNDLLNKLALTTSQFLEGYGYHAIALAATSVGIDPATHSTRLPHKTVATRAGLGWIGKCALLVTERFGSAVRLTSVLTDAKLRVNKPVESSRCAKCTSCVEICPGKAASGKNWQLGMHRDTFFNPFACREAALEAAGEVGIHETICGVCIAACPWTRKYIRAS